ncbi:MAG: hypothetical protein G8237_06910 [Magnetococcales bacterium]|nr:hypothetical protein [Magnetococcales bacterium]NGZ06071.1 hypothetical protein [Magnetococcales bacterium]
MTTQKVAQILSRLERRTADRLLAHLEQAESGLGEAVRSAMLLFEDLEKLDNRGLQTLLRETPFGLLTTALRDAPESLVQRVYNNLSQNRAEELRAALTLSGPVARHQVESARKEMIALARTLEARGRLLIPTPATPVIY